MMKQSGDRSMSPSPTESLSFEKALADLESILRHLENGSTSLEDSLAQYECGIGLLKGCYLKLREADQRILKLAGVDGEGKPVLEPFEHAAAIEAVPEKRTSPPRAKPRSEDSSY